MKNTIRIGKSSINDIVVDQSFENVSDNHATISLTFKGYLFKDHSAKGSHVNGTFVHGASVPINHGDEIVLADSYYLNWPSIDILLGTDNDFAQSDSNVKGRFEPQPTGFVVDETQNRQRTDNRKNQDVPECVGKFNYGALLLPGLWGLFNGYWWLLLVTIVLNAMNGNEIIETVSAIALLVISFLFGYNGNKWAWQKSKGTISVSDFDKKQHRWSFWGGLIGLVVTVIICLFYFR